MSELAKHEHDFSEYVGIAVFNGTATAWVPVRHVSRVPDDALTMMRCNYCGAQGYEVPA